MTVTCTCCITLETAGTIWAAMSKTPLRTAIDHITAVWDERAQSGRMSPQSADKFALTMRRFGGFAHAHGAVTCAGLSAELVTKFLDAHGLNRHSELAPPTVATRHQRRSAVRLFSRDAIASGYMLTDPTLHIVLPPREGSITRPVTDDEVELLHYFAESWATPTRHAATIVLALSGVHTGEIAAIRAQDIHDGVIDAPGTTRVRPRTLVVSDPWARRILADRINLIASQPETSRTLVSTGKGTEAQQQARVCTAIRDVIIRAGLNTDPTIRPSSLTAYPARILFDQARRIDDAARLLGCTTLDAAAAAIGWDWSAQP